MFALWRLGPSLTIPVSLKLGSLFLLLLLSSLPAPKVHAQLVQNITLGNPKALGLANAVTADPPGIDSIHFNPAGLAKIRGRQAQVKLLGAHITYDAHFGDRHLGSSEEDGQGIEQAYESVAGEPYPDDPVANTSSSTSTPLIMLPGNGITEVPFLAVPFGGFSIAHPEYEFVMASAVYSTQAIGFRREENDPAAFQGQDVAITRITYLSPSVGLKLGDQWYLGISMGFSWQGFGLKSKIRAPETTLAFIKNTVNQLSSNGLDLLQSIGPYDTVGTLELEMEDALSLNYNFGLLWEPNRWFALGFVYQSEATSDLEGEYSMTYEDNWMAMTESLAPIANPILPLLNGGSTLNAEPAETGKVSMEYTVPRHIAIGTSTQILPDLRVNLDIKHTDYDAWDYLDFQFSESIDFLLVSDLVYLFPASQSDGDNANPDLMRIKRAYESVWSWAIGFEYNYSDRTALRFGYEPRKSVIPPDRVDLLAPIADADLYTLGFEYFLDRFSQVQFAFGWLHSTIDAPAGSSQNSNSQLNGHVVYNPYAHLDWKAETNAYIFALSYDTKF